MMKVLLTSLNAKYIHANLAIRLLYQLNKHHAGLQWKEFVIKNSADEIADYCSEFEIVAFSCYIWNITPTLKAAVAIKKRNPQIKILLGGPEVSYDWADVISRDEVDFIITGEGEIPFQKFLTNYPILDAIPGLVYKREGQNVQNLEGKTIDLQELATIMPYSDDPLPDLQHKVLYIETSRGCPYKCEFCLASLDNKVRYLPMEQIKENLLYLMHHGRVIKFLDRTFNIKKDFTLDIFTFILEHHKPGNVFQFEITADILHPDIIRFINEKVPKGLFRFEIGIQSVNQQANLEVKRKQDFYKTKSIIEQVRDKVELHLDLIVGLPLDRWEETRHSFEEVFRLFAPELQLGFLKFLKGTPVRERYEQYGYVFDPNPPYQIQESNFLSRDELNRITQLEHALEIYWNKKRAVHTLKYITLHYSIFDFLQGLGSYFETRKTFLQYSLKDVYEILNEFAVNCFPNDTVLHELVCIDYCLYHNIKPAPLFVKEIDKKEKNAVIENAKLNHHKYRYMALPLRFDFYAFSNHLSIKKEKKILLIEYKAGNSPSFIQFPYAAEVAGAVGN